MYAEIEQPLEIIEDYIRSCLSNELGENGLLHDVKSYKSIYRDDLTVNTPAVWLYMDTWQPVEEHIINRANTRIDLVFPVEVACITHKKTLEKSDKQATSIQARVIESFIRNWKRVIDEKYHIICTGFRLIEGYTDGNLPSVNQRDSVIIKGVLIEFYISMDWMRCIRLYDQENENNENNDDNSNDNDFIVIGGGTNG